MTKKLCEKAPTRVFPLILSLIILANPVVRLVDVFPDFIACFIIAKYLEYASHRAPFFEEARSDFIKLGIINLLKIPANAIIVVARSGNVADFDIIVLFSFTFSVIEAIVAIIAINNLFAAFFYLGERSDNTALITPFKISKKREKTMSPEALKLLWIAFTVIKAASCALPEMCLLTRSVDTGSNIKVFRPQALYPYAIVLGVTVVIVLAIISVRRTAKYVRAIMCDGLMKSALDGMIEESRLDELTKKIKVKRMKSALSILAIASLFTLEVRFDNWNDVNLFPGFIFGFVMLIAVFKLSEYASTRRGATISSLVFCAVSAVRWFVEIHFLDNYGYDSLVKSEVAKDAYLSVIITSAIECVAFIVFTVFISLVLISFVQNNSGISPEHINATHDNASFKQNLKTKVYIFAAFSAFTSIIKLVWVVLRYNASYTFVATDDGIEGIGGLDSIDGISAITASALPWFNIVVIAAAALFIGYSFYLASELKEEVELKYS